jgi:hypothetical protein
MESMCRRIRLGIITSLVFQEEHIFVYLTKRKKYCILHDFTVYLDMHKRKTLSYDKPENRLPVEAEMTNHVFFWVKYYISSVSAFSNGFFAPQSITVILCQLISQGASLQKKNKKRLI